MVAEMEVLSDVYALLLNRYFFVDVSLGITVNSRFRRLVIVET